MQMCLFYPLCVYFMDVNGCVQQPTALIRRFNDAKAHSHRLVVACRSWYVREINSKFEYRSTCVRRTTMCVRFASVLSCHFHSVADLMYLLPIHIQVILHTCESAAMPNSSVRFYLYMCVFNEIIKSFSRYLLKMYPTKIPNTIMSEETSARTIGTCWTCSNWKRTSAASSHFPNGIRRESDDVLPTQK